MKKPVAWLAVISVFFACAFCSPGKPDFTGTWVQVGGPPMPGTTPDPDLEARLKVKQDSATRLTTSVTVFSKSKPSIKSNPGSSTFNLDGTERENPPGTKARLTGKATRSFLNQQDLARAESSAHTLLCGHWTRMECSPLKIP
jgi:hypothetical protein